MTEAQQVTTHHLPACRRWVAPAVFGFLLAALMLAPAPAMADGQSSDTSTRPRATTKRALAIWGPSSTPEGARLSQEALESVLPPSTPFPSRILDLSDWLGAARFRLGGSASSIPCQEAPSGITLQESTRSEIQALIARGKAELDDLEFEAARATLATAEARLACQESFLSREAFLEVSFYSGLAAFYQGDLAATRRDFMQAASVDPSRPWDPSYPPEPQSTFLSAVQDVVASPKGRVYGDMRGTNYREVWLDGQQLDLTKAIELSIQPGRHVVQALDQNGGWSTFLREVGEGATLTLFSDRGMEQMVLDGPDGVLQMPAAATLQRRAEAESLDEIYVVRLDPQGQQPPVVLAYSRGADEWVRFEQVVEEAPSESTKAANPTPGPTEATPEEAREAALLRDPDYRTGATFGFKAMQILRCDMSDASASGLCPDGTRQKNDYIGGLVNIDVRLVKGLNLDFRFGSTVTDFGKGGTLLPEFGFGLRYRFLTGLLQPYAGAGGDLLFGTVRLEDSTNQNRVVVYGGVLLFGGLDIEFPDGFRISVEGGGGALPRPGGADGAWPMGHFQIGLGRFLP